MSLRGRLIFGQSEDGGIGNPYGVGRLRARDADRDPASECQAGRAWSAYRKRRCRRPGAALTILLFGGSATDAATFAAMLVMLTAAAGLADYFRRCAHPESMPCLPCVPIE